MKYTAAFILPLLVFLSFNSEGAITFVPIFFAFVFVPIVDQILGENKYNLSAGEIEKARRSPLFDMMLYGAVLSHLVLYVWFIFFLDFWNVDRITNVGHITAMGLMCGVFGINVAHELGHRTDKFNQFLAKLMLSTSLYNHFFIEHNRGHHRNVGTHEDAATARQGESLYLFWFRAIVTGWLSAWSIVAKERRRKKVPVFSLTNEMVLLQFSQVLMIALVVVVQGWMIGLYACLAAVIGIVLLETVDYIEHYGLTRQKINENRYSDVLPIHSWNADFVLGRLVLFELTRHSDHHTTPSKHYQLLDSKEEASTLPAGYPTMMLLALIPPLWFSVMDKRIPVL
jgi:alkane 1-monooxygenase